MKGNGKIGYGNVSLNGVMCHIPDIMGLDMTFKKDAWEGRYYITGEPHPYKRDKLKVKKWTSTDGRTNIWVHEQGGESLSLPDWMVKYGGEPDIKSAYKRIAGNDSVDHEFMLRKREWAGFAGKSKHVLQMQYDEYKAYEAERCELYLWMCRSFGERRASEAWRKYCMTTDYHGNAVFWYVNADGEICKDKIVKYRSDGHRDKAFGGGSRFKVADGYTERCYFGSHLAGSESRVVVVESEKTALVLSLFTDCVVMATGGKSNLRDADGNTVLLPDMDAREEWAKKGRVVEWWKEWPEAGEKSDVCDWIVWMMGHGVGFDSVSLKINEILCVDL
jgi:hypothetical protein